MRIWYGTFAMVFPVDLRRWLKVLLGQCYKMIASGSSLVSARAKRVFQFPCNMTSCFILLLMTKNVVYQIKKSINCGLSKKKKKSGDSSTLHHWVVDYFTPPATHTVV